jgi:hypothetical protein
MITIEGIQSDSFPNVEKELNLKDCEVDSQHDRDR